MCPSQVTTAPLFTTNSISVPPIASRAMVLHSDVCCPRMRRCDFMLIDNNFLPSFSSDPPLSECSHLTSIDSILSIPPHTVSLGVEGYNQQALHAKSKNVQHDAVMQYICNVGFGGTGKSNKQEDYPTPQGPVARTKESLGTLKPRSDVQTIFDMIRRFPLDDCDESSEDGFIHWETIDKNTNTEYYMQSQGGYPTQQPPSPGSLDAVLSCWETCPHFSYHGCNLGTFGPIPCQRGSSTIPDREHDLIVHQQCYASPIENSCYAPRMNHKVLTPDPLNIPQVQMREVEDLEKNLYEDGER
ncbi:hypothetical protein EV359DRAFT_66146 [Lentinula novae-zelandiae]|nr:hypothetical protein EV359DRAFT_66146 [Lentinula novae-zelandiae]